MKALNMAMESVLKTKKPLPRIKEMQKLKGGVGSKLLDQVQIEKILKRRQLDKEERAWKKVLGLSKPDPRKSNPKRTKHKVENGTSI